MIKESPAIKQVCNFEIVWLFQVFLAKCKEFNWLSDYTNTWKWSKNPQQSRKSAILKSSGFSRVSWENVKNLPDFLIILTLENGDNRKSTPSCWSNYFIGLVDVFSWNCSKKLELKKYIYNSTFWLNW